MMRLGKSEDKNIKPLDCCVLSMFEMAGNDARFAKVVAFTGL